MSDLEEFYESLPDEIDLLLRIDKKVFRQMYSRVQEEKHDIVDERHVLTDWVLGAIRNDQIGVKFFYENGANCGIPSVRFLDDHAATLKPNVFVPFAIANRKVKDDDPTND